MELIQMQIFILVQVEQTTVFCRVRVSSDNRHYTFLWDWVYCIVACTGWLWWVLLRILRMDLYACYMHHYIKQIMIVHNLFFF